MGSLFPLRNRECVGIYLFSRAASSQVFSAPVSLTSVFGMGTGGTSSQSTPTIEFVNTPSKLNNELLCKDSLLGQALDRLVHACLTCRHAYTLCLSTL